MNDKVNINLDEYTRYKYLIENIKDNIKDNIWEIDLNFIYTYISPTIKEMCGYEVDEIIGRSVFDFLTDESKIKMQELWSRIIYKRVNFGYMNSELYELQAVCKNGEKIGAKFARSLFLRKKINWYYWNNKGYYRKENA